MDKTAGALALKQAIDSGQSLKSLWSNTGTFELMLQHHKACSVYLGINAKVDMAKPWHNWVIAGPSGSGKTLFCRQRWGNEAYWKPASSPWFAGYHGQNTVICDDHNASWFPHDVLMQITDPWRDTALDTDGVKGGHAQLVCRTWVFTTNTDPRRWYNNVKFHTDEMWEAFERRVTHWMHWDSEKPSDGQWIDANYTGGLLGTNLATIGHRGQQFYRVCRDNPTALLAYFDRKAKPIVDLSGQAGVLSGAHQARRVFPVDQDPDLLVDEQGRNKRLRSAQQLRNDN